MAKLPWKDRVTLITGAGSGIGKALAERLAALGAKLILTDINENHLNAIAESLGDSVILHQTADVSSKQAWKKLVDDIAKVSPCVDILINNAGITTFDYFDEMPEDAFERVMDINFNGVVYGCRYVLPLLEKSNRGLVVNLASIFGLIAVPSHTPYHASKFAVRGFTEALRQDFIYQKKSIDVLCVMPGGIRTNIAAASTTTHHDHAKLTTQFAKLARTTPEQAAAVIEKGMRNKTFRILIGPDAKIVDVLYKAMPENYYKVFNKMMGVDKLLS